MGMGNKERDLTWAGQIERSQCPEWNHGGLVHFTGCRAPSSQPGRTGSANPVCPALQIPRPWNHSRLCLQDTALSCKPAGSGSNLALKIDATETAESWQGCPPPPGVSVCQSALRYAKPRALHSRGRLAAWCIIGVNRLIAIIATVWGSGFQAPVGQNLVCRQLGPCCP